MKWHTEAGLTAFGGLIALAAAIGIGRFVYTPILPAMMSGLGLSKSAAGVVASANFLGYLLGALLAAWPNLPGSRRAWLLSALAVSAITTAAMGLASTMPLFLTLRFIGGGTSAIVLVFASAIVLERQAPSALHFAGVGSGIAVSAVLVALLLHCAQGWRSLWLASGGLCLVALLAVATFIRDAAAPSRHTVQSGSRTTNPALLRLVAAYGLFGFGYVITATFLVAIVRTTPSIRALEPVIWVVFGLAAVPSVALWARIATRLGIPATFAIACVVEACGVLASVAWPTAAGAFASAILVGGTFMGLTALGLVRARALAAGDPRRVLALMTGAFGVGQIVGPSFAGMLSDRLGSFAVPSLAAVAALLIAAILEGASCTAPAWATFMAVQQSCSSKISAPFTPETAADSPAAPRSATAENSAASSPPTRTRTAAPHP